MSPFNRNNNEIIQDMQRALTAVNNRLERFLDSGNYNQVTQRLQSSDGFMRWKNDNYQAYWENLRNSFHKGVSIIPGNEVENNPFFKTINNLGVKGRLDLYINKSNTISHNSTVNPRSPDFDLDRLKSINSDLNDSLNPELVNTMNRLFHHEVIKQVDGKWSIVLDSETLSSLWSNIFYPYISSNPHTIIAVGSVYLLSGLLIKRSISKFNSKLLSNIRNDSLRGMSNPATQQEMYQHQRLCESHDKVLFWMNSVEMVLVCGFAYFIGSELKPNWPPITIPLPYNQSPSSLYPNPNPSSLYPYPNPNPNPYSYSFLFPFLPFNKMSKRVQSIIKFILLILIFIIFIYYGGPLMAYIISNKYLFKLFIILFTFMFILHLFFNALIILNYSIRTRNDKNVKIFPNKYLPKFIKNHLLNLADISKYYNSNTFVKLYLMGGTVLLILLILFIIILL